MTRLYTPADGVFSQAGSAVEVRSASIKELIDLENRMGQLLNGRHFPHFFKTSDEIEADFEKKSSSLTLKFTPYSDTLDGCMNIQQSFDLTSGGYMEENY